MGKKEPVDGKDNGDYERKLLSWRSEGYRVDRLQSVLSHRPAEAQPAFEAAERGIEKLREVAAELRTLEGIEESPQLARLRDLLTDPWASGEAESALLELQVLNQKRWKEAQRKKREEERRLAALRERTTAWKGEGFEVGELEAALEGDVGAAEERARQLDEAIARLRTAAEELHGMETSGLEAERGKLEGLLKRPDRVQEVEEELLHLRVKVEKTKRERELSAGKEKAERARLAEKLRTWKNGGYTIDIGPAALEQGELGALRHKFQETEEAVTRLEELRDELDQLKEPELSSERESLSPLMKDPAELHHVEERLVRLQLKAERLRKEKKKRAEEERRRLKEFEERIKDWEKEGYDIARLRAAIFMDPEALKKEIVLFRIHLRRVKELEAELRSLPSEGMEQEVTRLLGKTKSPSLATIAELETGIAALKSVMEARRELQVKEKEEVKREKQELVEKLMGWVEKGYRDGLEVRLEDIISKDLPVIRDELGRIENKVQTMERLRVEMEAMDAPGLEAERIALCEVFHDLSRTDEAQRRLAELRHKYEQKIEEERKRAEEDRAKRQEWQGRFEEWGRLGYNVSRLEALLGGDLEVLRKEMALAAMKVQRAEQLRAELSALNAAEFEKETAEILAALPDLEKITLNERRLDDLRSLVEERAVERRKRADMLMRMEEWRAQGYDTGRLERVMKQDIETITKQFMMFRIRVQKLRELGEELRSLDTTGFEKEEEEIRADLKNVDKVADTRARLSELEIMIGRRMSESTRHHEEKKKLKEDCMAKMSAWLEDGFYVDELEPALGKDPSEMMARFDKFETAVQSALQLRQKLEALYAPGFEEFKRTLMEKLRDVSRLEEVRREVLELSERIERRMRETESHLLEEEQLRQGLLQQLNAWKDQGHEVGHLEPLADGKVEHLRKAVLDFRIQLERRRSLEEVLAAMDTRGFEAEAAKIRDGLRDLGGLKEANAAVEALQEKARLRKEHERQERKRLQDLRDACIDRFMGFLGQGYNIETLEATLELPTEELARECERVGKVVARLGEIEKELHGLGPAEGDDAAMSKIKDTEALGSLEEYLARRQGREVPVGVAQANPPAPVPERVAGPAPPAVAEGTPPAAKREMAISPDKLAALVKKLGELKAKGHDVNELEQYLGSDNVTSEGLKTRLEVLNRKLKALAQAQKAEGPAGDDGGARPNEAEQDRKHKNGRKVGR